MAHQITKDIEDKVRAYVDTFARDIPVSAVYVFGSHAKGGARADSDIDVAVISSSFAQNSFPAGITRKEVRYFHCKVSP